jgi:hypothetical protein
MEDRYRLRDGMTIEELEDLVKKGVRREEISLRPKRPTTGDRIVIAVRPSREAMLADIRETDRREELEERRAEEEILKTASPDLAAAINNIKSLEALLAEKVLEVRRLTALVSNLERAIAEKKLRG